MMWTSQNAPRPVNLEIRKPIKSPALISEAPGKYAVGTPHQSKVLRSDKGRYFHACPIPNCQFLLYVSPNSNNELKVQRAMQRHFRESSHDHLDKSYRATPRFDSKEGVTYTRLPNSEMVIDNAQKLVVCREAGYVLAKDDISIHAQVCTHCSGFVSREGEAFKQSEAYQSICEKFNFTTYKDRIDEVAEPDSNGLRLKKYPPLEGLRVGKRYLCLDCYSNNTIGLHRLNCGIKDHSRMVEVKTMEYFVLGDTKAMASRRHYPVEIYAFDILRPEPKSIPASVLSSSEKKRANAVNYSPAKNLDNADEEYNELVNEQEISWTDLVNQPEFPSVPHVEEYFDTLALLRRRGLLDHGMGYEERSEVRSSEIEESEEPTSGVPNSGFSSARGAFGVKVSKILNDKLSSDFDSDANSQMDEATSLNEPKTADASILPELREKQNGGMDVVGATEGAERRDIVGATEGAEKRDIVEVTEGMNAVGPTGATDVIDASRSQEAVVAITHSEQIAAKQVEVSDKGIELMEDVSTVKEVEVEVSDKGIELMEDFSIRREAEVEEKEDVITVKEVEMEEKEDVTTINEVKMDEKEDLTAINEVEMEEKEDVTTVNEVDMEEKKDVTTVKEVEMEEKEEVITINVEMAKEEKEEAEEEKKDEEEENEEKNGIVENEKMETQYETAPSEFDSQQFATAPQAVTESITTTKIVQEKADEEEISSPMSDVSANSPILSVANFNQYLANVLQSGQVNETPPDSPELGSFVTPPSIEEGATDEDEEVQREISRPKKKRKLSLPKSQAPTPHYIEASALNRIVPPAKQGPHLARLIAPPKLATEQMIESIASSYIDLAMADLKYAPYYSSWLAKRSVQDYDTNDIMPDLIDEPLEHVKRWITEFVLLLYRVYAGVQEGRARAHLLTGIVDFTEPQWQAMAQLFKLLEEEDEDTQDSVDLDNLGLPESDPNLDMASLINDEKQPTTLPPVKMPRNLQELHTVMLSFLTQPLAAYDEPNAFKLLAVFFTAGTSWAEEAYVYDVTECAIFVFRLTAILSLTRRQVSSNPQEEHLNLYSIYGLWARHMSLDVGHQFLEPFFRIEDALDDSNL
ncbi:hypothetical protein TRVA0_045S00782 [Trichomonascus vanleenenianus]|uniref:Ebp2p n=1 Tax=Trichomonascus vanleenenianus TaxID=2268995 RepID=UPI003EC9C87A